jgi:hypothetical protein
VDVDVGRDVARLLGEEVPARTRLEVADDLGDVVDLVERDIEALGDGAVLATLEIAEVMIDHAQDEGVMAVHLGLDVQALGERARRDPRRIEALQDLQHLLGVLGIEARLGREHGHHLGLVDPIEPQIAAVVEVSDDEGGEAELVLGVITHLELPEEVLGQPLSGGGHPLVAGELVVTAAA